MEEIRRIDQQLFVKELLRARRLALLLPVVGLALISQTFNNPFVLGITAALICWYGVSAWQESVRRRFISSAFAMRWAACQERLAAYEEVLKKLRKDQIADLREMPTTIRRIGESLYVALRKADIVAHEVAQSELKMKPPAWSSGSNDPQSMALYQVADRNIAEYRAEFAAVMAGVHRAEAQSAVFITTLDSLRMKMLGYRLRGKKPEMPSHDFLEALAEARMQLQSIDSALEELDLGHYPRQISVVAPNQSITDEPSHLRENT